MTDTKEKHENPWSKQFDIYYEQKGLLDISGALGRLSKRNEKYMINYAKSDKWKRFREGFLQLNYHFRPEDVVDLTICDLAKPELSHFLPAQKKIKLCINKIPSEEVFQQEITFQVIKH
eukprot:TRINITY_DN7107_c0_g1_i4.p1 TRINITY_DN7107_c0_g1~~TRINITY_DN7107_c0_g1_i4.p1  ORF type:complete len:119 (-),score=21.82 TRINITY_DN7107_c0_g1_i4:388-744(-)